MSEIFKLQLSRLLYNSHYWIPITVLFLQNRGLSNFEIYITLGIYYFTTVLFEYPTGIIGDLYSHRISTIWGYIVTGIGILSISLSYSLISIILSNLIISLGTALSSGSDDALLFNKTDNFKKTYSQLQSLILIWSVVTISIGSILFVISPILPFITTGISMIIAGLIIATIRENHQKQTINFSNIFETAIFGIKHIYHHHNIKYLIMLLVINNIFFYSLKWLFNPIFFSISLPVIYWGFIISGFTILNALGAMSISKLKNINLHLCIFLLVVSIFFIGISKSLILVITCLAVISIIQGLTNTFFDISINNLVDNKLRSTVLSAKSFLIRLGVAPLMIFIGVSLNQSNLSFLMFGLSLSIGIFYVFLNIWKFKITI